MRSTLLFTLVLFLTACSNGTTDKAEGSAAPETKAVATQETAPAPEPDVTPAPEPVAVEEAPAEQVAAAPAEPVVEEAKESPLNGHTIFVRKCASCHGENGEKIALNVSEVIGGWERERTVAALKGYKDGSYGKSLKGIMKGQVNNMSDEQIEAVAEYIAIL